MSMWVFAFFARFFPFPPPSPPPSGTCAIAFVFCRPLAKAVHDSLPEVRSVPYILEDSRSVIILNLLIWTPGDWKVRITSATRL